MKKWVLGICFGVGAVAVLVAGVLLWENRYPIEFEKEIELHSRTFGVEAGLVVAVAYAESGFDKNVVSQKGAVGVMQILPSTAQWIAGELEREIFDLTNASTNIEFGCFYLAYLFEKFDSEIEVLAAYNAGEGNVRDWKNGDKLLIEDIPFEETKNYVKKVLKLKKYYKNKI